MTFGLWSSGETGRRKGLKIPRAVMLVPVRFRPGLQKIGMKIVTWTSFKTIWVFPFISFSYGEESPFTYNINVGWLNFGLEVKF
jgi:hypothetical protein